MADHPSPLSDLEQLLDATTREAAEAERKLDIEARLKKKAEQQRDFWRSIALVYEARLKDLGEKV